LHNHKTYKKPIRFYSLAKKSKNSFFASQRVQSEPVRAYGERWSFLGGSGREGVILAEEDRWKRKKNVVLVRFNQMFGFNGGGGGGDNGATVRVLGNFALAIGLTYLSMTGHLGWLLDAIVSIWVLLSIWLWSYLLIDFYFQGNNKNIKIRLCLIYLKFGFIYICMIRTVTLI